MKKEELQTNLNQICNNRFKVSFTVGTLWLNDNQNKIRYPFINANKAYEFAFTILESERNYKLN